MLSDKQIEIIALFKLAKCKYSFHYIGENLIDSYKSYKEYSKKAINRILLKDTSDELCTALMEVHPSALNMFPSNYKSEERVTAHIDGLIQLDELSKEDVYLLNESLTQRHISLILDREKHPLRVFDVLIERTAFELTKNNYDRVINRQLKTDESLFYLNNVPESLFTTNLIKHLIRIDAFNAGCLKEERWSKGLVNYALENNIEAICYAPVKLVTQNMAISLVDAGPDFIFNLDESIVNLKLAQYALAKGATFHKLYEQFLQRYIDTKLLKSLVDQNLYSAKLIDDLNSRGIDYNPVRMFIFSKFTETCKRRVLNYFSDRQLALAYHECKNEFDIKITQRVIGLLKIQYEIRQEFLCPCCDKPLPKSLIDAIRASADK